jgi:fluoride exporter
MTLESCAFVLLGGFLGGIARLFLAETIGRSVGETFPWGTLAVNVSGALAVGAFAGAAHSVGGSFAGELLHQFLVIGFLGGYTTVSSFSLQTLNLALGGAGREAAIYVAASASLCVVAVAIGYWSLTRIFA